MKVWTRGRQREGPVQIPLLRDDPSLRPLFGLVLISACATPPPPVGSAIDPEEVTE